jgi:hypothetical protein
MEAAPRRRWRVNFALGLALLWCVAVWFVVLYALGVAF